MKRVFLILLGLVIVLGVLAGIGFAGYQIGFRQAARASAIDQSGPLLDRPSFDVERGPFAFERGFEHRFERGFPQGGFERMRHRGGFGGFGLFRFFIPLAFLGILGLITYLFFTRSGWRLTRTEQTVQQTSPTSQTVTTVEEQETKNE